MFNRARIQLLESVRNEQAAKIKELEGKVHFLNTKVAYLEADNNGKSEVIKELKEQLKSEITQKLSFQQSFMQLYSPSAVKLKEELSLAYMEDEEIVNEMRDDFKEDQGEL